MVQIDKWFEETDTDFILFSQTICQYCSKAKRLLESKSLSYTEVNLDEYPGLRTAVVKETRHRTVPVIFDLRGDMPLFIGGSDNLMQFIK